MKSAYMIFGIVLLVTVQTCFGGFHINVYDYYGHDDELPQLEPEPVDIVEITASKYSIYTRKASWTSAQQECVRNNMKLVSITSQEESDAIKSLMKKTDHNEVGYWTGGIQSDDRQSYKWNDDRPFVYTNWAQNQPDHLNIHDEVENCIQIEGLGMKWNDEHCERQFYFICQGN